MANANIFQAYLQPPKSVLDYGNDLDIAEARRASIEAQKQQNALQALTLQQNTAATQQQAAERNALQRIASGWTSATTPDQRVADLRNSGLPGLMTQADNLEKGALERTKTQAAASKDQAEAEARRADTLYATAQRHAQGLARVRTPQDAVAYIDDAVRIGLLPPQMRDQEVAKMQQQGLGAWLQAESQAAIPAVEKFKQDAEMKRAQLTADTQVKTTAMNNATSRANNAATIAKDFKVAGIDPQTGNFIGAGDGSTTGMAGMVDALGTYKLDPNVAFSRMAPAMKAGVIAQVQQKYPDYDPTTYTAKTKAARDFSSGQQGNAMRSFATAGQHLDQLGQLVDALDNGNVQLVNKLGNAVATATGSPAPTNFEAAKDVVSKEVVKAIVGAGGGVAERAELAHLMDQAKSPAQLKGVIQQYRGLMEAQHQNLLAQRRAAGLPDSTIPQYISHSEQTPAADGMPPDIADLLKKHGGK